MILVRSHLQRLSGNKWLIILPFFLLIAACKTSKEVVNRPVFVEPIVVEEPVQEQELPIVEEVEQKVEEKVDEVIEPVIPIIEKEPKDKILDIALILPFDCTNYPDVVEDIMTLELSNNTKIAAEFYSGVKMALDELNKMNHSINVQVFDNSNQAGNTEKILNSLKGDIDVIIGPVFNKELRDASEFAKKRKIPIISPLSSSTTITSQNPFYYSANASSDTHIESIISFITKGDIEKMLDRSLYNHVNYETLAFGRKINLIHFSDANELNTIKSIRKVVADINSVHDNFLDVNEISINLTSDLQIIKSNLDSTKHNFIVLPLYSESNVLKALNLLSQLNNNYSMTVFGMSTWRKLDKINYDYLNLLKVFITSSSFIDKGNVKVRDFIEDYKEKYRATPGEYTFQGYDLVQYLSRSFRNGEFLKPTFENNSFSKSMHTRFEFVPRTVKSDIIEYYDNKFVHVLQFDNYLYKRVE